jgi:hypothetical protein
MFYSSTSLQPTVQAKHMAEKKSFYFYFLFLLKKKKRGEKFIRKWSGK